MDNNFRRQRHLVVDVPYPEEDLAGDLEWMLQSKQVSQQALAGALIRDQYADLYLLAYLVLGNASVADACILDALGAIIVHRDQYWGKEKARLWLFQEAVKVIHSHWRRRALPEFIDRNIHLERKPRVPTRKATSKRNLERTEPLENIALRATMRLKFLDRLCFVLYFVHGFLAEEIEILLQRPDGWVSQRLLSIELVWLRGMGAFYGVGKRLNPEIVARIYHGLRPPPLADAAQDNLHSKLMRSLARGDKKARLRIILFQGVLGVLVISLVAGLAWYSNVLALDSLARRRIVRTVIITQVIRVTPHPPDKVDVVDSAGDVREKLLTASQNWQTLFFDGVIVRIDPASDTNEPLIRRNQVWISAPQNSLVLSGPLDGAVDHVWFSVNGKVYDVDVDTGKPELHDIQKERLPIFSRFADFAYPDGILQPDLNVLVVGQDRYLDRRVEIVDLFSAAKERLMTLWVDDATGIILQMRYYAPGGEQVIREVALLELKINPAIPAQIFDRTHLPLSFQENWRDAPLAHRLVPSPLDQLEIFSLNDLR